MLEEPASGKDKVLHPPRTIFTCLTKRLENMPIQVFAQKVCYNMSCGLVSEDAIRNNLRNHFGSMVEESFPTSSTMANKNKKKKKTEAVSAAGTTDGTAEKTEAVSAAEELPSLRTACGRHAYGMRTARLGANEKEVLEQDEIARLLRLALRPRETPVVDDYGDWIQRCHICEWVGVPLFSQTCPRTKGGCGSCDILSIKTTKLPPDQDEIARLRGMTAGPSTAGPSTT